ncbi:MAG TPA: PQQ-binding-like beta-propeller repeat protein, partial [bacterium]
YFGGKNQKFYCVDLKSGEEVWKYQLDAFPVSPPVIIDNVVFMATWPMSFPRGYGSLYALI